jgi:hypothetical protein
MISIMKTSNYVTTSLFRIGIALVAAFIISSCNPPLDDINPRLSQLKVYVYGSLGNPKNDARVSIHLTEADARDNTNEVVDARFTDAYGYVDFVNIEPNKQYWIRAKPLAIPQSSFGRTDILVVGKNNASIETL